MKFTVESKQFCSALQFATTLVSEEVVKVSALEKEIVIEAGHNGMYFMQALPATVEEQGEMIINSTYVTGLQLNAQTCFASTENRLSFKSGALKGTVETSQDHIKVNNIRPIEDIPVVATVPLGVLKEAFTKTKFHNTLGLAEGVKLVIDSKVLKMSSSDFTRAAFYIDELSQAGECDITIASGVLGSVLAKIKDPEISIGVLENCIQLSTDSCQCVFPTTQLALPDIETWLKGIDESKKKGSFRIDIADFLSALSSVSSLKPGANIDTVLKCALSGNELKISVVANHGSADTTVAVFDPSGEIEFDLDSKKTLELLSVIKTGIIVVGCWEESIMVTTYDDKATYVIPTQVSKEINRA